MSTYTGTSSGGTDTSTFNSGTTVVVGNYGGTEQGWFFLSGVTIPQGATISAATLTTTAGAGDGSPSNVRIIAYGQAADTVASGPTSYSAYTAGTRTTASAAYTPTGSGDTVNVAGIVAEIVGRSGWVSGNNLLLYVQDNGSPSNTDISYHPAATLAVTYSTGSAATASGSLSLGGSAVAVPAAAASGSLALSGAATAAAPATAAGSLSLAGTATAIGAFTCTAVVVGADVDLSWPAAGASYAIERDGALLAFGYVGTSYTDVAPGAGSHAYRIGVLA